MSQTQNERPPLTAVDDVRKVRESIARQHGGDLQEHVDETVRLAEELRRKLNVRVVPPPKADSARTGTRG